MKLPDDYEWAHDRVTRMAESAFINAGVHGVKLCKGHGYPDEAFSYAQDARALKILLGALEALSSSAPVERPRVDLSKLTTTMVEREWQAALKWREKFLDHEADADVDRLLQPLDSQIVCYLVADCMTMRDFYDVHETPSVQAKLAPAETQEERADCPRCYGFGVLKSELPPIMCPDCGGTGEAQPSPETPAKETR